MTDDITLEERKVIYRARRGLKEIDVYFDPYVKNYYLTADPFENRCLLSWLHRKIQTCWTGLWKCLNPHALN